MSCERCIKYEMRAGAGKSGRDASIGKQAESAVPVKYNTRKALFFPKFTIRQGLSIFLWPGNKPYTPHVNIFLRVTCRHVVSADWRQRSTRRRPRAARVVQKDAPDVPERLPRPRTPHSKRSLCFNDAKTRRRTFTSPGGSIRPGLEPCQKTFGSATTSCTP